MLFTKELLKTRKSQARGFTLIEILVAITVFTVAVLGLAIGATTVVRNNQISYFTTVANNLAQDKLEELKAKTVASLPSCASYSTSGCSDTSSSTGLTFTRSWQLISGQPAAGLTEIDVQVTWTDYTSHTLTVSSAVKQ